MKNIKRICMALIVMMLSVTMVIGTLGFSASALTVGGSQEFVSTSNVKIVSKVKYGESFDVPPASADTTVTVTAPNGLKETVTADNKVKATQVGNYTVTYTATVEDKTYDYDFTVRSYVEEEYSVAVKYNGADIPTYAKVGEKVTLPAANLVYYDDDDNAVEAENAVIKIKTNLSDAELNADGKAEIELESAGVVYVTYYAVLGNDAKSSKVYSKNFEIKVQDDFEDTVAPTLSIVNVPTNASLNRKITLPKATASDNFDANVKVAVEVTVNGKAVTEVDVDDNGYAYKEDGKEYKAIEFDNDKTMSFYPTEDNATYTVTYRAYDDYSGIPSGLHTYTIKISDTTAPVFKEVEEWKIPAKWGKSVRKNDADADATITFPVPTVVDNAGTVDGDGNSKLTVTFKITDPDNNTVLSFTNILDSEGSGSTFTGNSSYGETGESYKFTKEGFEFDFSNVKTSSTTGDFTVEYGARDMRGNRSTKTYKINVVDEFEDSKEPNAAKIEDAPTYIVIAPDEDSFVVPAVDTADENDSRPHVEYVLKSSADSEASLKVSGGETLDIVTESAGTYLVNDKDEKIKIAGGETVTLELTVTDKLGNSKSDSATVKVFSYDTPNDSLALDVAALNVGSDYKVNDKITLGKFEINGVDENFRKFTGYEVSVKDPNGNYLPEVSSEYYYDTVARKIVVRNISFTANKEGAYQLSVRAFDLSGQNIVNVTLIDVKKGNGQTGETTAATAPSNGNINVSYSFRNETIPYVGNPDDTYFAIYKVVGGRHSVMGTEFTAKNAGSYIITEGYAKYESGSVEEMTVYEPAYTVSFADNESPVIEAQGVMQTYSEKSTSDKPVTVTLPSFIAYSANGNAKNVDVRVRHDKSASTVAVKYDEATNAYSFVPEKDGVYTITVSASVNNKAATPVEYKMNVGDVVGPKFALSSRHDTSEIVGKEFKFKTLTATPADGEDANKFTYTKRLYDPSGNEVTEATIKGVGTNYAGKEVKDDNTKVLLSKSGTYEVVYEVEDEVGNVTTQRYSISVTNRTGSTRVSIAAISTVLIVVGVVLIIAVILYFVLFRKRKAKNNN